MYIQLWRASREKDIEKIQILLLQELHRQLRVAAQEGEIDVVHELVQEEGIDVNAKDESGLTALHFSCKKDQFAIINLLLDNGANVDVRDSGGWTPLHLALKNVEVARLLVSKGGANVNAKINFGGQTTLHLAVKIADIAMIRFLLNKGADLNSKDKYGWTPLHHACFHYCRHRCSVHYEIIDILVQNQPLAVAVTDNQGFLPVDLAVMNDSSLSSVYYLLRTDPHCIVSRYHRES
jgi:hypothetical protein